MEQQWIEQIPEIEELKIMPAGELEELCGLLRQILIHTVSKTGGHLSANLGVVELTVALHQVFDLYEDSAERNDDANGNTGIVFDGDPPDNVIWDVGHQCYIHKLLTGRGARFHTLRQEHGLSGFPDPGEHPSDTFVVGHASSSISAANGIAKAKTLTGKEGYTIAVIGDGAMTGGLAYEGLCNAGRSSDRLIVILNDNRMSISQNVGFIARYLAKLRSQRKYLRFKKMVNRVSNHIPLIGPALFRLMAGFKTRLKKTVYSKSSMFEEMGFYYLGPIDGHDLQDLKQGLLAAKSLNQPVLLHVETVKGKGYPYAEVSPDTYHGIGVFDVDSGEVCGSPATFSTVFGEELAAIAEQDDRICAMTAAMITGTGLSDFAERFPKRFFDVGIAESHAITFSSGLAKSGMIPVFAVYSTFLQRCFDQLINDTVLNNTHIVLAVDRAGVVPDDGETHQGLYDVGLLNGIPNVTVYSPSTFAELRLRLRQAIYDAEGIAVVRYPKGEEFPLPPWFSDEYKNFQYIGRESARQLAVTYGRIFGNLAAAADTCGVKTSLLKLNRIRPIDEECIRPALSYERILFFEEAFRDGGVGERFGCQLSEYGYTGSYEIVAATESIGICGVDSGLAQMGLDVQGMAARLLQ